MDDDWFNRLAQTFASATPRRAAVRSALGGALIALVTERGVNDVHAKRSKKSKKKRSSRRPRSPRCIPVCAGKECGDNGCSGSCGACANGTCTNGQCVCPFAAPCSPGVCCVSGQACIGGNCAACPVGPTPCNGTNLVCGKTSGGDACGCITSAAGVGRCVSPTTPGPIRCFACTTDAQCDTELGLPAGNAVCVGGADCLCGAGNDTGCMLNCLTA